MKFFLSIFSLLSLIASCTDKEPAFTVTGDDALLKNIKVNIEIIKDSSSTMATAYYNGKKFAIDNDGALHYTVFVSYKDQFFYSIQSDNLHGKIKGDAINEIVITKKGKTLYALYRPLEKTTNKAAVPLQPSELFFSNVPNLREEKQKFTAFYVSK